MHPKAKFECGCGNIAIKYRNHAPICEECLRIESKKLLAKSLRGVRASNPDDKYVEKWGIPYA